MPEVRVGGVQVSDLAGIPTSSVESARAGTARLKDVDETTFAVLREEKLASLNHVAWWALQLLLVESLLRKPASERTAADFGEQPWLGEFSDEDLATFVEELYEALLVAAAEGSPKGLHRLINDWQLTAGVLSDQERREVLLGHHDQGHLVEVARPA